MKYKWLDDLKDIKTTNEKQEGNDITNNNNNNSECDYQPIQSELYLQYKDKFKLIDNIFSGITYSSFFVVIFIGTWKSIEEGLWPFNMKWFAHIAYDKRKWGNPIIAFIIALVFNIALWYGRRIFVKNVSTKCYEKIEAHLDSKGHLKKIKPISPKDI